MFVSRIAEKLHVREKLRAVAKRGPRKNILHFVADLHHEGATLIIFEFGYHCTIGYLALAAAQQLTLVQQANQQHGTQPYRQRR